MTSTFRPSSLDHVALWVEDRAGLAAFLCDHLGMHVIEETDSFTLVGVDAKLGKLTLFDADGPRERGGLKRVALRADDAQADECEPDEGRGRGPHQLLLHLPLHRDGRVLDVDGSRRGREFDLDHVVLELTEPESAAVELERMGFERRDGVLAVADRELRLERGQADDRGRPLLNHVALLVDDARRVKDEAERGGLEVDDVKDAPNTFAVFLRGPEGLRIEYVEHKPGFALA